MSLKISRINAYFNGCKISVKLACGVNFSQKKKNYFIVGIQFTLKVFKYVNVNCSSGDIHKNVLIDKKKKQK